MGLLHLVYELPTVTLGAKHGNASCLCSFDPPEYSIKVEVRVPCSELMPSISSIKCRLLVCHCTGMAVCLLRGRGAGGSRRSD